MNLFDSCPVLAKMYETQTSTSNDGNPVAMNSNIPPHDAMLLFEVVASERAKTAVEVGMAHGASSLAILAASEDVSLDSIDPFQHSDWLGCGERAVRDAGFSQRHTLWRSPDYVALPKMLDGRAFDFAFIDGWHTFDHAFLNWWYIDKMLITGGVVGFDDCYMPSVSKAIGFALSHRKYTEVYAGRSIRTRYFRKQSVYTPPWDFFANF